jgi:hypothetical protein
LVAPHIWPIIGPSWRAALGLVLMIFTVTAASSIWAISQQETFYSASMALQVNDPEDQQAGLVTRATIGGMNLIRRPDRFRSPGALVGSSAAGDCGLTRA